MRLRTHGITRDPEEMVHPTDALWYNEQVELGFNYRMTDFQAALLTSQIQKLERFKKRRREIVEMYDKAFSSMPEIVVQKEIPFESLTLVQKLRRIESVLDESVRPLLARDGGGLEIEDVREDNADFSIRSWGMSHDYPIALRCGSNMVRVGTAIFGAREY